MDGDNPLEMCGERLGVNRVGQGQQVAGGSVVCPGSVNTVCQHTEPGKETRGIGRTSTVAGL